MTGPRAYCLPNNAAQEILPEVVPWHNKTKVPPFASKEEYRNWCKKPTTHHLFFSMVEAATSTLRVGHGNLPFRIHGLIADYDCYSLTDLAVDEGIARIPAQFPPRAWNRTFSGGVRLVWVFEHPVFYYSKDIFTKFITRAVKELKLKTEVFAGLDEHITMPELYYCAGAGWHVNEEATLRGTLLDLWMFDACKIDHLNSRGVEVPLTLVEAEVARKFPNRWQGEFVENARGVRFWDANGDAKSAIVKTTGMIAFTGPEPFLSWEKLFGREFVQRFLENKKGRPIHDLFSNGTCCFRQLDNQQWDAMNIETTKRHLRVEYGLSERRNGDSSSEIDDVLNHLERHKRVEGAIPFPLDPRAIIEWNGKTYLNNSSAKLCAIAPGPCTVEQFPWVWTSINTMMLDTKNRDVLLTWIQAYLRDAVRGKPDRGHALFIAGGTDSGKTMFSRRVLAAIFGGYADASHHMVEGSRFNSSLFDKSLWCIDDSSPITDQKKHAHFSAIVKQLVANDALQYEAKYGYSGQIPFNGRLVVTLNGDPISLGILPDTDNNLLDKVCLLRASNIKLAVDKDVATRYVIIAQEIPFFCRWLLDDFKRPEWLEYDSRFGFKAWHDSEMLDEARSATSSSAVVSIMDAWRDDKIKDPTNNVITLTPTALYQELMNAYPSLMRGILLQGFGRQLSAAINNHQLDWIERKRKEHGTKSVYVMTIPIQQK